MEIHGDWRRRIPGVREIEASEINALSILQPPE
jgi:hypothetical protein